MSLPMHVQGKPGHGVAGAAAIRCPLCGHPTGHTAGACTLCPIGRWGCGTLTCSRCGYRFVAEGKWLARLERWRGLIVACFGFGRGLRGSATLDEADATGENGEGRPPGAADPDVERALLNRGFPTVAELAAGEAASVEAMGSVHAARLARLSAYGVVPGSHLKVIQTRPAILIEVDGTRLALEVEVAAGIQVRRLGS